MAHAANWKKMFIICFSLSFFGTGTGGAADNSFDLSLTAREVYNDNVFYDDDDPMEDMITTLVPAIEVGRTSERLEASAAASLISRYYHRHQGMDETDQTYQGDVGIGITERLTVSADAGYTRDSRRDRDIEATGILFSNAVRDQWTVQMGGQYVLSEKSSLQLSGGLHDEAFKDDPDDAYDDFRYYQGGLAFSRYLTDTVVAVAQAGYTAYEYPEQDIENWSGTLGMNWQATETVSGFIHLGGRRTTFTYLTYSYGFDYSTFGIYLIPEEKKIEKSGFVGSIGGTWQGNTGSFNLTADHDLQATSGTNGTTQRTSVSMKLGRRWNEYLYTWVTGRYYYNRREDEVDSSEGIDRRSFSLEEGLRYSPLDWLSIAGGYRYTLIEDKSDRQETENTTTWIVLDLQFQLMD
jgi:hypothetical protein